MTRVAALQLQPRLGDVDANLEACAGLVDQAVSQGAEWVALPEFFTTGMAFLPEIEAGVLPYDGPATDFVLDVARRHGIRVGGSFLCRDEDGHVRNAFVLAGPDGALGRHDKDLPTMWENAFYIGGEDDGLLVDGDTRVGVALCWELIRSRTARRLRERCDLVVGGSAWWSVPAWRPHTITNRWARANATNAEDAPSAFARLVGAPVVHAAHAGPLACPMPWMPLRYRGHYEGGAVISDATGRVLARRRTEDGAGTVVADVELGARPPVDAIPDAVWLVDRGPLPALAWRMQRAHGRRHYAAAQRGA